MLSQYFKSLTPVNYNSKGHEDLALSVNGIYAAFACTITTNNGAVRWQPERLINIGKAEGGNDSFKKRISDHVNDRDESDSGKHHTG